MSSQSKQIAVLVRMENALYYQLREYVQVHFSSRNKIINEAIRRYLSETLKRAK